MRTVCEANMCNGCMACADRCPKQCILIKNDKSSLNAIIDESKCVDCKLCEKVCPNISAPEKHKPSKWYQGWAEEEFRKKSSSGGAASAIMKAFVSQGGYVASCLFDHGEVVFEITDDLEVLKRFTGSKYVKSNPSGIYKKIEERLKTHKVLFIGLPCQVAAVKKYIKIQDNLYTIDLICHGTPSMSDLTQFLSESGYNLTRADDLQFRKKTDFGIFIDHKKITPQRVRDEYTTAFLASINYTENCYFCNFASFERVSDITLGDSWGTELIEEIKKGLSLILCQTEKGQELLDSVKFELLDVDLDNAINHNHQIVRPSIRHPKRDKFISLRKRGKSYKFATLCCLPKQVLKQKLKHVLKKLRVLK